METREPPTVRGRIVDAQTRCVHYRSEIDIVALRFYCCGEFYPCHLCHEADAGHETQVWPRALRRTPAVLCGRCRGRLTIEEYLSAEACPGCGGRFNPGCSAHHHLYFEV